MDGGEAGSTPSVAAAASVNTVAATLRSVAWSACIRIGRRTDLEQHPPIEAHRRLRFQRQDLTGHRQQRDR